MTLYQLIRLVEGIASSQPAVRSIVENDWAKINSIPDLEYGVFSFVQGVHSTRVEEDMITYQLTLIYIDRLISGSGKSNQIQVQSTAVQVLTNILSSLNDEGVTVGDISIQPFNQRFADECSGAFTTVSLGVLKGNICPETFINNDIKIY